MLDKIGLGKENSDLLHDMYVIIGRHLTFLTKFPSHKFALDLLSIQKKFALHFSFLLLNLDVTNKFRAHRTPDLKLKQPHANGKLIHQINIPTGFKSQHYVHISYGLASLIRDVEL